MNKNGHKTKPPSFFNELGVYITPYRTSFALSVAISLLAVLSGLTSYGFAGVLCGEIFEENSDFGLLIGVIGVIALCKLCNVVFLNLSTYVSHKAAFKALRDIRLALSDKLMKLPLSYFVKYRNGQAKNSPG